MVRNPRDKHNVPGVNDLRSTALQLTRHSANKVVNSPLKVSNTSANLGVNTYVNPMVAGNPGCTKRDSGRCTISSAYCAKVCRGGLYAWPDASA